MAAKSMPRWSAATQRHAWLKWDGPWDEAQQGHRPYRCLHCGVKRWRRSGPKGYWLLWQWPDGTKASNETDPGRPLPKCPGPMARAPYPV